VGLVAEAAVGVAESGEADDVRRCVLGLFSAVRRPVESELLGVCDSNDVDVDVETTAAAAAVVVVALLVSLRFSFFSVFSFLLFLSFFFSSARATYFSTII